MAPRRNGILHRKLTVHGRRESSARSSRRTLSANKTLSPPPRERPRRRRSSREPIQSARLPKANMTLFANKKAVEPRERFIACSAGTRPSSVTAAADKVPPLHVVRICDTNAQSPRSPFKGGTRSVFFFSSFGTKEIEMISQPSPTCSRFRRL